MKPERDPTQDERVGSNIREIREDGGWRIGKFATAVGTTHSHMSNIEAGRKRCTPEMARRIADTLGVPLAAITTGRPVHEVA